MLGEAIRTTEAKGGNRMALAILRLLTFSGTQKIEITGLKWSEVDFECSCLRIGDSRTGAKVIPVGQPALHRQILANHELMPRKWGLSPTIPH